MTKEQRAEAYALELMPNFKWNPGSIVVQNCKTDYLAGFDKALELALEIYEKGFENNWVVQDVIDRIKALASEKGPKPSSD